VLPGLEPHSVGPEREEKPDSTGTSETLNQFGTHHREIPTAYYDSLNCIRYLWSVLWHRPRKIYSLRNTHGSRLLEALVRRVWPTGPEIHDWTFQLWELVEADGGFAFDRIQKDTLDLIERIASFEFDRIRFSQTLTDYFDLERLRLYFKKVIGKESLESMEFLNAVRWHAFVRNSCEPREVAVFLPKHRWSRFFEHYATNSGLQVKLYRVTLAVFPFGQACRFVASTLSRRYGRKPGSEPKANLATEPVPRSSSFHKPSPIPGRITTLYTGNTVALDPTKRSDWFWLLDSDIPKSNVLVYFQRTDIPFDAEMQETLDGAGMEYVALSGGSTRWGRPVWRPGRASWYLGVRLAMSVVWIYFSNLLKCRRIPWLFFAHLIDFSFRFAYWHDFFVSYGVKVNVNNWDFSRDSVPMHLALENAGGVSVSYQWSNLSFLSISQASAADVFFSFGPAYKRVFVKSGTLAKTLAFCGYITDHSFAAVRPESLSIRKKLKEQGAKFVVCFFDESSSDNRHSILTHNRSRRTYEWFLEQLLADQTLGLVLKPGYPRTLKERLGHVSGLLERAMETGRCVMLDTGRHVTDEYPAQAAQAADLCVALLFSGTAGLEAYLAGTPTVFLDLERCYWDPVYSWGRGTAVFDSFEKLQDGICEFRQNYELGSEIGNLSHWVEGRDSFRDGRAAHRMGQYIEWLRETLSAGGSREEALGYAHRRYSEEWGPHAVVCLRPDGASGSEETIEIQS
jgi:hypothetical protein